MNFRYTFFLLTFLSCTIVYAGKIESGYQALSVYDYFKAKKQFTTGLKYNNSPAAQGLAIIYYRTDNPFHNLDSALRYVGISIEGYELTKQRKKDKYAPLGYTLDSLQRLREHISNAVFAKKLSINEVSAYQDFIDVHVWASKRERAIEIRDSLAFFIAVHENTSQAFETYLSTYPESQFKELAEENFHHLQFVESTGDGSLSSYEKFVQTNPSSPLVQEAQEQVFELMTESGKIEAFELFLTAHSDYPQRDEAWRSLFQKFLTPYSEERLNAFNEKYPDHTITQRVTIERERMRTELLPFPQEKGVLIKSYDGDTLISLKFDGAGVFSEGLGIVGDNGKLGVIDVSGEIRVPFIYDGISPFLNGQSIVEKDEKFGVIDRNGRLIMPVVFDDIGELSCGLRFAQKDEFYGYYDSNGNNKIQHQFEDAFEFNQGIAKVVFREHETLIDTLGVYLVPPYFESVMQFSDSIFRYTDDGYMGLCDAQARKITEPTYDFIGTPIHGLAVAMLEDRIVYIDAKGTIRIDKSFEPFPNYMIQGTFQDSLAVVFKEGKYGRISLDGSLINKFKYDNIGNGKGVFTAMKEGYWGLFNKGDKTVLSAEYDELFFVTDHLLIARKGDTTGMIQNTGKLIIPFAFESIEKLTDSLYIVKQNGRFGVYKLGEMIFPPVYDKVEYFNHSTIKLIKDEELIYFSIEDERAISSI